MRTIQGAENLSERKLQILMGAIEAYIEQASPITSQAVHQNILQEVSPATLRNELNALEAMGYLKQLHTSGGRVPTTKAYRLFVNNVIGKAKLDIKSLKQVKTILETRTKNLTDIISSLAETISKVTDYPTMVMINSVNKLAVESVKIIPLLTKQALVLLQTNAGIINNSISINESITEQNCIDASNFLTKTFRHKTIEEMIKDMSHISKDMTTEITEYKHLIVCLIDNLSSMANPNKVNVTNTTKLLSMPEYSSIEKAKEIISIFEDEQTVKSIMQKSGTQDEISITIGNENENEALADCSVVKANYNVDGENVASIGIIGPERMNYAKIASALKYVIDELNNISKINYNKEDE